ncbi:ATP-binding protein [Mycolicibacterium sp. CR10]|uniref:ATP-binding protein n=1 Tax=Mycolicibacterium sp. CR10 TaxID=2562314 RepID=UPI001F114F4B|nr:ATP-binding protein [Mycolicibacterium sp. CR10]
MTTGAECATDELRTLFLFESLSEEQLDRLCRGGSVTVCEPGPLFVEGEPATCFYILLDGEIACAKRSGGMDIETIRTSQRGTYFGAWSAYLEEPQTYETSGRVTQPSRLFTIDAEILGGFLRTEFPMACHFLNGATLGRFNQNRIVGPHDRLLQLAQLTAGLTHELNNPAAAAARATSELRSRVAGLRNKLALLADGSMSLGSMQTLVDISNETAAALTVAHELSPLQKSDREEAIGEWLDARGVGDAWDIAPVFAEAALDDAWLDRVHAAMADTGGSLDHAMRWLSYTVETELLMNEIAGATARVSALVTQAKQYSQLDRAPYDVADLRSLLTDTLAMLSHKLGSQITVVRDFDDTVPPIPCWPAELNQVWTNLVDNAVSAIKSGNSSGTLTVRTRRQGDCARVEICDDGPGVPEELKHRVFDPFFTTKPIGEGTGLGLDFAARTVDKHHGSLWVESSPGDTRFIALLPLEAPVPEATT